LSFPGITLVKVWLQNVSSLEHYSDTKVLGMGKKNKIGKNGIISPLL